MISAIFLILSSLIAGIVIITWLCFHYFPEDNINTVSEECIDDSNVQIKVKCIDCKYFDNTYNPCRLSIEDQFEPLNPVTGKRPLQKFYPLSQNKNLDCRFFHPKLTKKLLYRKKLNVINVRYCFDCNHFNGDYLLCKNMNVNPRNFNLQYDCEYHSEYQ